MDYRARFPFALIAVAGALLTATGCPPNNGQPPSTAEPVLLPSVASIEIIPSYVSVPAGTSFTLRARLRDSQGNELSDSRTESVSWKITQGLSVSSLPNGSSIVVNALTQTTTSPTMVVVASLSGVSETSTIDVVPANPSGTVTSNPQTPTTGTTQTIPARDWIRAPHVPGDLPTIALVDGKAGAKLRNDSTFAFAGSNELDSFDCSGAMCGEITIFSPTLGIRRDTVGWKAGCDYVDFAGGSAGPNNSCPSPTASALLIPIPQRVHVPVVIWQASNSPIVDSLIVHDTAYALSVFNQPWTGLALDVKVELAWAAVSLTAASACDDPVYDITNQLIDAIPSGEFTPGRITVAYVDDISNGGISAFACPYDSAEGSVVVISKSGVGGSTLAHELGHALGQWLADSTVHVDQVPHFDKGNLMWSAEMDDARAIRRHLTLGQLFQMSFRDSSFVKRSPGALSRGLVCPPKPGSETPCPRLAKDPVP